MSSTQINHTLSTCPACRKPITITFTVDVSLSGTVMVQPDKADVMLTGKITGAKVAHDCNPVVVRQSPQARGVPAPLSLPTSDY